jgi:hypothetical protein
MTRDFLVYIDCDKAKHESSTRRNVERGGVPCCWPGRAGSIQSPRPGVVLAEESSSSGVRVWAVAWWLSYCTRPALLFHRAHVGHPRDRYCLFAGRCPPSVALVPWASWAASLAGHGAAGATGSRTVGALGRCGAGMSSTASMWATKAPVLDSGLGGGRHVPSLGSEQVLSAYCPLRQAQAREQGTIRRVNDKAMLYADRVVPWRHRD